MAVSPYRPRKHRRIDIFSTHIYFRFIYSLSLLFGTFPFYYHRGRFIRSNFFITLSFIFSALVGSIAFVLFYIFLYATKKEETFTRNAGLVLFACLINSMAIFYVITACSSIRRGGKVQQIIDILEKVDGFLKVRMKNDFSTKDFLVVFLNFSILFLRSYNSSLIIPALFIFVIVINLWLTTSQFSILASLISMRLKGACECLDQLKHNTEPSYKQERARELSNVHKLLCDACEILQNSFACLITILIAVCFVGSIVLTFYIYAIVKQNNNSIQLVIFEDDKLMLMLYFWSITWNVAGTSAELTQKTKDFNCLLYQLMINDKSSELIQNDKLLLHLMLRREVVLTACGMFNLDFTLVHSMIAAVSTYLAMIIQFDN